jgi:hypothetical protein
LFTVILDVENPIFFNVLDKCAMANDNLVKAEKSGDLNPFTKLTNYFTIVTGLAKLYFLPAIETKYIWTQ